jgi:PAS domain S-box-containing protein
MDLDDHTRDEVEIAALLHDVGKIGVPDKVLLKPGRLLPEELTLMARHAAHTNDILASCGVPRSIMEIVHYSRAWYGGAAGKQDKQGDDLPLGARMLSIIDAFDSMTTDHVYRPARSRERALAELYEFAGRQFDPDLVRKFQALFSQDQNLLTQKLARRWLHRLSADSDALPWKTVVEYERAEPRQVGPASVFEKKLIDNMHDGVVFVDSQATITLWNTGAERLTGVSGVAACGRTFLPSLMEMCNSHEQRIPNEECPVAHAIITGVQWLGRVSIMGRQGRYVAVDLHAIPVRGSDGAVHGATVLLHDAS